MQIKYLTNIDVSLAIFSINVILEQYVLQYNQYVITNVSQCNQYWINAFVMYNLIFN